MKERPILFSGPMVRAILDGRKTQTRRIAKVKPIEGSFDGYNDEAMAAVGRAKCPYGQPGDRLWVRETWQVVNGAYRTLDRIPESLPAGCETLYHERDLKGWIEYERDPIGWRPSIHMPRWASRIMLEITGIRVERLNDISEEDARAEGIIDGGCLNCGNSEPCGCADPQPDARDSFIHLWEHINGAGSWMANPWVWVVSFEKVSG